MFMLKGGYNIPKIGLGTYLAHGEQLYSAVDNALKCGYRSFDTAKYYENEKELGMILKDLLPKYNLDINDIFLTTKVFPKISNTKQQIGEDIEQSLEFLGRNYLDLVLIHYPRALESTDDNRKNKQHRKEAWVELENLKKIGKINSIGVSNYEVRHIKEMKSYSTIDPCVNQVEFHPHFQRKPLKDYCQENDILFQAFSPLGRQNKQLLEDEHLLKIANEHDTSTAVIIICWIMQSGVGVVPKSITPSRIEENFQATSIVLSEEEMNIINGLNRDTPYVEDNGWLCV